MSPLSNVEFLDLAGMLRQWSPPIEKPMSPPIEKPIAPPNRVIRETGPNWDRIAFWTCLVIGILDVAVKVIR